MPDGVWCQNVVEVGGYASETTRLFSHRFDLAQILPPPSAEAGSDPAWRTLHWGTPTNAGGPEREVVYQVARRDDPDWMRVTFTFRTAAGPPVGCFEALVAAGHEVTALHRTPEADRMGVWSRGESRLYSMRELPPEFWSSEDGLALRAAFPNG